MESGLEFGLQMMKFHGTNLALATAAFYTLLIPAIAIFPYCNDDISARKTGYKDRRAMINTMRDTFCNVDIIDLARLRFSRNYRKSGEFDIKYPSFQKNRLW